MARTARNSKIDTRGARVQLKYNKSGYWVAIAKGRAFGYRKGSKGGRWVARLIDDGVRQEHFIGIADDMLDADGNKILNYSQAQKEAYGWFEDKTKGGFKDKSAITVNDASEAYLIDYKAGATRGGGKGVRETQSIINAFITPELGPIKIQKLTRGSIQTWRDKIASSPARTRSKQGAPPSYRKEDKSEDGIRRRRSTANRILTVLKAILNHAYDRQSVGNKDEWAKVKPFREVDAPKIRWLNDDEARRITNASPPDLRQLVIAALLTGARYSELTSLRAQDFTAESQSVYISKSKSGKARHIHLTDEGITFFKAALQGRDRDDLLFIRENGALWKHSDQSRPIKAASAAARIKPAIGFHILRHSYASRLAMRGVPMAVIAAQLGHSDTRMTERHYAHLGPSYVAQTVRNAFENLNLVDTTNIEELDAHREKSSKSKKVGSK